MEREILFRGKRTDNREWVEGMIAFFFDKPQNSMIMPSCYFGTKDLGDEDEKGNPKMSDEVALGGFIPVTPESVGQFTGLLDKNGKKIFEGDALTGYKGGTNHNLLYTGFVRWQRDQAGWIIQSGKYVIEILSLAMEGDSENTILSKFEVIGNIHDQ